MEVIEDLNEDEGLGLQVRVGVETAEAVVALGDRPERGEAMVFGDGVNTASRLQGVAPVNGVVVGPGTYAATQDVFEFEELEPVALKSKAELVPLWRAHAARARFGTDVTRRLTTPLVGRQIELGIITGCLQRALQECTVQLVSVVGEPGVGKSRLVAELFGFVDGLPELVRWRQGRCLPYGEGVTFWALGEIVKAEAGILESDTAMVAGEKLDAVVPADHPDASWLRARLRPLAGLEAPEAAREENFAAWRAFLELLAEDSPVVLVFEDLHWADDALLAFLEHLADYAQGVSLLLVATARPEFYERAPGWAAAARNANRINLGPLSRPETSRLISNLLEQAVLPVQVQDAILERCGGNPLYAEEFVRLLKDRRILSRTHATWSIDAGMEIPMPFGVRGLIAARLDTLSAQRKRLLQAAAVIGKVFWAGAVAEMAEREPDEVARALHELSRTQLVRPAHQSSMAGQAEYGFYHALVRDVCYGQIPHAERTGRHRKAAGWIEQAAGERLEDHAAILASHYLTALQYADAASGPDTDELRSKAIRYLTLAGERSMGINVEAAERHFAGALELAGETVPERPRILARHADALQHRGRYAEAAEAYLQAIEGFRAQEDIPAMAVATARLGHVFKRLGDPRGQTAADQTLRMLEPLGPSPELVAALADAAAMCLASLEKERAVKLADRAIALAAELGQPESTRALGARGSARTSLGDEGGVQDMRRALELAIAQGQRGAAMLHFNLADALWLTEGSGARLRALEECLAFAQRRGIEAYVLTSSAESVPALVEFGSYDKALERAHELVPRLEDAEDLFSLTMIQSCEVAVLTRRGQLEQAIELSRATITRTRASEDPQLLGQVLCAAAALHLAAGDHTTAHGLLEELEQTERSISEYAAILPEAARSALALHQPELARRLADRVPPKPMLRETALLTVDALIAGHERRHTDAEARFAAAAQAWQRLQTPWEQAHALLGQARCLLAVGRPADAAEKIHTARELFNAMGATLALAEADTVLERASALAS